MFESALAKFTRPNADLRDPVATYNKYTAATLSELSGSGVNWAALLAGAGIDLVTLDANVAVPGMCVCVLCCFIVYVYVYVCVCVVVDVYIYMCICVYRFMCMCVCVYVCVCIICACVCIVYIV